MLLQVCVPDGLVPGMAMTVASPTNEEFTITVPDGCQAGDLIDVDLPVSDSTMHETQPLVVTVVVPDGCRSGDKQRSERERTHRQVPLAGVPRKL